MKFVQIFAAMALVVAMPASASTSTVSIPVSYGDLNLASAKGRAALDRRVSQAVRRICGDVVTYDLRASRSARQCAISAEASARSQVEVAVVRATTSPVQVAGR